MNTRPLRSFLALLAACAAGLAQAQKFPDKPITLIVPWAAGGSTDQTGRALSKAAEAFLGQPVVVVNKPGGSTTIGMAELARAKPDGYTIGTLSSSSYLLALQGRELSYHPIDAFTYVSYYGDNLIGIAVPADSRWKTLADLIAEAKANPGKLNYGTLGIGSTQHLAMERIGIAKGLTWTHAPYRGTADTLRALIGGEIDQRSKGENAHRIKTEISPQLQPHFIADMGLDLALDTGRHEEPAQFGSPLRFLARGLADRHAQRGRGVQRRVGAGRGPAEILLRRLGHRPDLQPHVGRLVLGLRHAVRLVQAERLAPRRRGAEHGHLLAVAHQEPRGAQPETAIRPGSDHLDMAVRGLVGFDRGDQQRADTERVQPVDRSQQPVHCAAMAIIPTYTAVSPSRAAMADKTRGAVYAPIMALICASQTSTPSTSARPE